MKLLLIILLFASLSAKAQEPFVLNKSYPIGWVVTYPNDTTMWISKTAVKATAYPVENVYWTRYHRPVPTPIPAPTPVPTPIPATTGVQRSTFDSLLSRVDSLSTRFKSLETKQQTIDIGRLSSLIKVSQKGFPLLYMVDDTTIMVRSLIPGDGIDFETTESTIKPIIKQK